MALTENGYKSRLIDKKIEKYLKGKKSNRALQGLRKKNCWTL
jgi:hypothetical protein